MPAPLSVALRERVVKTVSDASSRRQAATRFGASVSGASRWSKQVCQERQSALKLSGRDHASHRIEAQVELSQTTFEARPAIFLPGLRDALARHGVQTSTSSLSRFFARHGITRKQGAIDEAEQARADVRAAREAWFENQDAFDPDRLVFLDGTTAAIIMARRYGRAPWGGAAGSPSRNGHDKTTTISAALYSDGMCATTLFDEATNGTRFRT